MARQIIILERLNEPSDFSFRYLFWATVPAARVGAYADAAATSAFKSATGPELAALQAGQVVEHVDTAFYPAGTAIAVIEADLVAKFNVYQAQITAANPTVRYGTYYDGAVWTIAGTQ